MRLRLVRSFVALLVGVGASAVAVAGTTGSSSAEAVAGPASVTMNSDPGAFVTGSTSYTFTEPQDDVFLTLDPDAGSIAVGVLADDLDPAGYSLRFETPGALAPGHYTGATGVPADAGHAGIAVSGQHRACFADGGEFTILDLGPGRVWLTYVHRCESGPAVFGEIRIGLPDQGLLQVTARSIEWPTAHPGVAATSARITVVNQGAAPSGPSTAAVMSGTDDFSVLGNACTSTLAPGARCEVTVGFTPSRPGVRRGSLRLTDGAGVVTDVGLGGSGVSGRTSWDMSSEQGDYVGAGLTYHYSPDGAWIRGELTSTRFLLSVDEPFPGDTWDADFSAPSGETFVAGTTYTGAVRSRSDPTLPGMDVSGNGRGCGEYAGEFTVHELTQRADGTVAGVRVSFEQHCDTTPDFALTGEISLGADDATAPTPDTTGPAPVSAVHVDASGEVAAVTWTDPPTDDWADTVVTVTSEGRPGARTIYAGRGATTLVTGLDPAHDSSIVVRSRDTSGNLAGAVTVEVPTAGTPTVTATPTPTATPTGTVSTTPTATTTSPTTNAPALSAPDVALTAGRTLDRARRVFKVAVAPGTPGERVVLQRRVHGVWSTVDRTPLGPRGRARLVAAVPDGRSLWRAKVRATDEHLAATSPRIRVRG